MRDLLVVIAIIAWLPLPSAAQTVQYAFTNLAGVSSGPGSVDGAGTAARFSGANGLAVDRTGNIYVADTSNHTIRKVTPAGVVTTLAGRARQRGSTDGASNAARFNAPAGVALDDAGNLYVTDSGNSTIRKVTPEGVVTTIAGGVGQTGSNDGTGSAARFSLLSSPYPSGMAIDHAGNVYVADSGNHTIRKITPIGVVTTLAGAAGLSGTNDGTGAAARFSRPTGVAVDSEGNLFVVDSLNLTIRKITPGGNVTTLAGSEGQKGSSDGTGDAAQFGLWEWETGQMGGPSSLAIAPTGTLYVADVANRRIRTVTPGGVVTTLAGSQDQIGWAGGVAADTDGTLYIGDGEIIRKITPEGVVTTLAGSPWDERSVDGVGSAARFTHFYGPSTAIDKAGNLYVADRTARTIRKISQAGLVTTFAGSACTNCSYWTVKDGPSSVATFSSPQTTAMDKAGNVYVGDYAAVRKITPDGVVSTIAGVVARFGSADGIGASARFQVLYGLAVDNAGNIYVADWSNHTIRKITPSRVVTTLAGSAGKEGSTDGTGSAARFRYPTGVAVDSKGTLYVADRGNQTIRKVTSAGVVTTLAGNASITDSDGIPLVGYADGIGSVARFNFPTGLVLDESGNLFVADTDNSVIRKVTPSGVVTTVAGTPGLAGGADGIGSAARFSSHEGVAIDSSGALCVMDSNRITKGTPILVPEPRIGSLSVSNGAITAQVSGLIAGWTVVIESSSNLRDWLPLQTNAASGASQSISHPINPASRAEFLRASAK